MTISPASEMRRPRGRPRLTEDNVELRRVGMLAEKLGKLDHDSVAGSIFLRHLLLRFNIKTAAEFGRICDIPGPVLSKIKHDTARVPDWMLIAIHESLDIDIAELKRLMRACLRPVNGSGLAPPKQRRSRL